jgi:hypothetical protein
MAVHRIPLMESRVCKQQYQWDTSRYQAGSQTIWTFVLTLEPSPKNHNLCLISCLLQVTAFMALLTLDHSVWKQGVQTACPGSELTILTQVSPLSARRPARTVALVATSALARRPQEHVHAMECSTCTASLRSDACCAGRVVACCASA